MISKNTGSIAYGLYKLGVEPTEDKVKEYIGFYNKNNFLWYCFDDTKMQQLVGQFDMAMHEDKEVLVDLIRYNHLFGCLRRMCKEERSR